MRRIDFYTTIIDNYGDAGFSLNLALSLLSLYPDTVIRYFCDDKKLFLQLTKDLEVKSIMYFDLKEIQQMEPAPIIFNFFDRKIDFEYLHSFSFPIEMMNFSYFLMHRGVGSLHDTKYQSKNVSITHYIPSLLPNSGGVIINPSLENYKRRIQKEGIFLARKQYFPHFPLEVYNKKWISIFCYPETFQEIKNEIGKNDEYVYFLFDHTLEKENVINMPFLNIFEYYQFLHLCDKNIVRGENSLVESMLTGKPFLWDIYKESNGAHKEKIEDFSHYLTSQVGEELASYIQLFHKFNTQEEKGIYFDAFCVFPASGIFGEMSQKIYLENNLLKNLAKRI